jgi:hypothetical protein
MSLASSSVAVGVIGGAESPQVRFVFAQRHDGPPPNRAGSSTDLQCDSARRPDSPAVEFTASEELLPAGGVAPAVTSRAVP